MTIAAHRPLKGARPRAGIRRAWDWWIGELRACRDDARRFVAVRGQRSLTIEAGERYWLLRRGDRPIGQLDVQAGTIAELSQLVPPAARRRPVIIEIPPDRALAKTIELPSGASGQLDRILSFEIARHFPFPAERVHFRHRLLGGNDPGAAVKVEIVAVPCDVVDDICRLLRDAGMRPLAIAVTGGDGKPLFLSADAFGTALSGHGTGARLAVLAAVFAAVTALASWPLAQRATLGGFGREIAALKPGAEAALRAGEAEQRAAERSAAILALRNGRPPLIAALDGLSRELPDGAWLLSLSIAGRDVVLEGLAPSAATIALALEKGQPISGIVFRSPITREASGLEHFQLGGTLRVVNGEAKP